LGPLKAEAVRYTLVKRCVRDLFKPSFLAKQS
jgi:hypothetical protein